MHIKRYCTLKLSYYDNKKGLTIDRNIIFDNFVKAYKEMEEFKKKVSYGLYWEINDIDKVILNRFDLMDFGD